MVHFNQATIFNELLPIGVEKWGRVGELVYKRLNSEPALYKHKSYIALVYQDLGARYIPDLFSGLFPSVAYIDRCGRDLVKKGIIELPEEVEKWRRDQQRKTQNRMRR